MIEMCCDVGRMKLSLFSLRYSLFPFPFFAFDSLSEVLLYQSYSQAHLLNDKTTLRPFHGTDKLLSKIEAKDRDPQIHYEVLLRHSFLHGPAGAGAAAPKTLSDER